MNIVDDLQIHNQILLWTAGCRRSSSTQPSPATAYQWPQKSGSPKLFLKTWMWKRNITQFKLSYFGTWAHGKNMLQEGSWQLLLHGKNGELIPNSCIKIKIIHFTFKRMVADTSPRWLLMCKCKTTNLNGEERLERNMILIRAPVCPSYMPGQDTVQTQILGGGCQKKATVMFYFGYLLMCNYLSLKIFYCMPSFLRTSAPWPVALPNPQPLPPFCSGLSFSSESTMLLSWKL